MAIKYLYIDDQEDVISEGIKTNLTTQIGNLNLEIELQRAQSWNEQMHYFIANLNSFQGLLLDLKLEFAVQGQEIKHYAPALAQEIRTLVKQAKINDLPIFLCSTDANFKLNYDGTGKDLFDVCLDKIQISSSDAPTFISHVEAYQKLHSLSNDLIQLLGLSNLEGIGDIDYYFNNYPSIHEKAAFLLKQVVEPTGVLINEDILAIRLGVDKDASATAWEQLKLQLEGFKYKGIYGDLHQRWWMRELYRWWQTTFPDAKPLPIATADERAQYLSNLSINGLQFLGNPHNHKSTKYWYQCKLSKRPIDSIDGLRYLRSANSFSWQDHQFVAKSYLEEPNTTSNELIRLKKEITLSELNILNNIIHKRQNP